jgi:hypothetical protein
VQTSRRRVERRHNLVSALGCGEAMCSPTSAPVTLEAEAARLDARLGALEDRIDAELELGHHHDLVSELDGLVTIHPLRERL